MPVSEGNCYFRGRGLLRRDLAHSTIQIPWVGNSTPFLEIDAVRTIGPDVENVEQDDGLQGDFDMEGGVNPKDKSPPNQHQHQHAFVGGYPEPAAMSNHGAPHPAVTHEVGAASGSGHSKGRHTRAGAAAGGQPVNEQVGDSVGIHPQKGNVNLFGPQQGYDGGAMLTPGEMPGHGGGGEVWMGDAGGGDGEDVWEILHQMMDEPAGQPLGSSSPRTVMPEHATAGSKPKPVFSAGGFDMTDGNVEKLTKRLSSLEEEVLNLRQFTMTLIKERGDLAMRIQVPRKPSVYTYTSHRAF